MYFLCCSYRTRINGYGIIKLRISGLDKQINHSTKICIPIADWDSKKTIRCSELIFELVQFVTLLN
jgi:hypothetical protein